MEKDVTEKTVSDTMKIATIAAVAKSIKDNAVYRQFKYNGKQDSKLNILTVLPVFISVTIDIKRLDS